LSLKIENKFIGRKHRPNSNVVLGGFQSRIRLWNCVKWSSRARMRQLKTYYFVTATTWTDNRDLTSKKFRISERLRENSFGGPTLYESKLCCQ